MNQDDIEVAKLAAFTAGALNEVDKSTVVKSTAGPACKINPRSFIPQSTRLSVQAPPKHQLIKNDFFVDPPKTSYIGSEVQGTVQVDMGSLLIPMPDDLKKYADLPSTTQTPQAANSIQQPHSNEVFQPIFIPKVTEDNFTKLNKKLNKIIKILSEIQKNDR